MAILKCKMCGGDIQIHSDKTYGTCDSCGSVMTLPKASDDRVANLFNRANHFRRLNNFDKALSMYENILNEDNTNAEAHWGVVLARYGIEYVEDPKTHKRIPTCNRLQFSSILSDEDYLAALNNAEDWYTRSLYEQEALQISEIQKRILMVSNNVEPFDVFICYKEKTNGGSRTKDSVLAQDIYFQLTKLGYKVFFARITLEDKLGIEYEPYIFAALNSAKVMTVIGTKEEYFESAWVKNEWSRFLALMKKDTSKLLIPCFKGISPYELPDELSVLQSQDMSKIGFMQDLIRGVKKVLEGVADDTEEQSSDGSNTYKSLLERGFICLEDSYFAKADSLFEQVLNIHPKCAKAYIGKLLVERKLCREDDLLILENSVENSPRFKRALMYADSVYKQKLMNMKDDICERLEEERKQAIYDSAIEYSQQALMHADSNQDLYIELMQKAIKYFNGVKDFKDSDERIKYLTSFVHEAKYQRATKLKKSKDIECCEKAITIFCEISEYKDSQYQIIECKRIINEIKYNKALEYKKEGTSASLKHAASIFAEISDFNDADVQRKQCEQLAKEAEKREQEKKRKAKIVSCLILSVISVAIVFIIVLTIVIIPGNKYSNAEELAKQGNYDEAISIFSDLNDYGDAQTYIYDVKVMEMMESTERPTLQDKQQLAKDLQERVFWGDGYVAALKNDGTILVAFNDEQVVVEGWKNIVQISVGYNSVYGLTANGTVLTDAPEFYDIKEAEKWNEIKSIASGDRHIIGLKSDGTVVAAGNNNEGQCDVLDWTDIENIFAFDDTTIGLKKDGDVVVAGSSFCVSDWDNIDVLRATNVNKAALSSNGTVYYSNDTKKWNNIVNISLDTHHLAGVRSDGTVVAAGNTYGGRFEGVENWKNVIAAYAYGDMTIGIRNDGTVTWVGDGLYQDFSMFDDVIALYPIGSVVLGLKTDGTVVASKDYYQDDFADWNFFDETSPIDVLPDPQKEASQNEMNIQEPSISFYEQNMEWIEAERLSKIACEYDWKAWIENDGTVTVENVGEEHNVDDWDSIVAVSFSGSSLFGLRSDGTVVVTGGMEDGEDTVFEWSDIVNISAGGCYVVGIKSDGSVVSTKPDEQRAAVEEWNDIIDISAGGLHTVGLKSDGTVIVTGDDLAEEACDVGSWEDIVAVSAAFHTVGLKSDGTVVAAGSNRHGECDVENWTDIVSISAGNYYTIGLKENGTLIIAGSDEFFNRVTNKTNIESFEDIISICASEKYTIVLKTDGSIFSTQVPTPLDDFWADGKRINIMDEYIDNNDFTSLLNLIDDYISSENPNSTDNAYALRELVEPLVKHTGKLVIKHDDFENKDEVYYKGISSIEKKVNMLPFSDLSGKMTVQIGFKNSNWIFFKNAKIKTSENKHIFLLPNSKVEDVLSGGTIIEYCDVDLDDDEIQTIINSATPAIRFTGKDDKILDHTFSKDEINALDAIYHYSKLKKGVWKIRIAWPYF